MLSLAMYEVKKTFDEINLISLTLHFYSHIETLLHPKRMH